MSNVRSTNKGVSIESFGLTVVWINFALPIAAYSVHYVNVYPSNDKQGKLSNFKAFAIAPPGASAGYHYFQVEDDLSIRFFTGQSLYGTGLLYDWASWINANDLQYPSDLTAQALIMHNIEFNSSLPLRLSYSNQTDVSQTSPPYIILRYRMVNK